MSRLVMVNPEITACPVLEHFGEESTHQKKGGFMLIFVLSCFST